jgi:hypothetical protein
MIVEIVDTQMSNSRMINERETNKRRILSEQALIKYSHVMGS